MPRDLKMANETLIYEITAVVRPDLRDEYESYIDTHIPDLLETGAFQSADFSRSSNGRYRIRYEARSREALDQYLAEHSARLRQLVAEAFPDGIEHSRDRWEQIKKWTSE